MESNLIEIFEDVIHHMRTAQRHLTGGMHRKIWVLNTMEGNLVGKYGEDFWYEHQLTISTIIDFVVLIDRQDIELGIKTARKCVSRMC